MLECFVNHIVFQSLNMTQVTIAIKVSQWENDISSRKIKKDHRKKELLEKTKMAAKKLKKEYKKKKKSYLLQIVKINIWKHLQISLPYLITSFQLTFIYLPYLITSIIWFSKNIFLLMGSFWSLYASFKVFLVSAI